MTVSKMVEDLQTVGLIKISKGKYNADSLWYDTNHYEIYSFSKAKWSNLGQTIKQSLFEVEAKPKRIVIVKSKRTGTPKKKVELSAIEKKFIDFIEVGKSVLVVNGFIPYGYLKRKINRRMIPNILNKILSDDGMKAIFLSQFKLDNVSHNPTQKIAFNSKANIFDRYSNTYWLDTVNLIEKNGNYSGRTLTTHDDRYRQAIEYGRIVTSSFGDSSHI